MKPFAYVDAADEREAIAALGPRRGRFLPFAGGTDLLALMKNYVATPERLVNVKNLDSRVVRASDGGLKIGAAMTIDDLVNHPAVRQLNSSFLKYQQRGRCIRLPPTVAAFRIWGVPTDSAAVAIAGYTLPSAVCSTRSTNFAAAPITVSPCAGTAIVLGRCFTFTRTSGCAM